MLTMLFSWLLTSGLTTLLGWSAWRLAARLSVPATASRPSLEWLSFGGLAILTGGLGIWSLLAPLATAARWAAVLLVTGLLFGQWRALAAELRAMRRWQPGRALVSSGAAALVVGVAGGWLLLRSVQSITNHDTSLYHLQSLRWLQEYAAVPGLGNLHGRLAFNPALFLPMALLRINTPMGPAYGLGAWCYVSLMLLAARLVARAWQTGLHPAPAFATRRASAAAALLAALLLLFDIWLSSPTPDSPAAILTGLSLLLYAFKWEQGAGRQVDGLTALLVLLTTLALTVKVATMPLLLLPAHSLWASRRTFTWRGGAGLALLACAIVLPWLARNVVLSGYLVYPVAATAVPELDWQVPVGYAHLEQHFIVNVARYAGPYSIFDTPHALLSDWWARWWRVLPR